MFTLPSLPFEADALQPEMSEATVRMHHGGHHRAYVEKLNALVEGTRWQDSTLEAIILDTRGSTDPETRRIFQNAAQDWNHSMFWSSLAAPGTTQPGKGMAALIARDFGSLDALRRKFCEMGGAHFGSGWIWLVARQDALELITTHDAESPVGTEHRVLLVCDLWEHAYYLDYQNRRPAFLTAFIERLANWDQAEHRLAELGLASERVDALPVESAPDPRTRFQSPEMLVACADLDHGEKVALLEQWHLDLDNRLKAEEEGMSVSDPMTHRQESRLADETARVQSCLSQLLAARASAAGNALADGHSGGARS